MEAERICVMFWLSACCFVVFLLFCFLANGENPLPVLVLWLGKWGFEASLAFPIQRVQWLG